MRCACSGALVEDILAIKGAMEVIPTCLTNSLVLCGCVAYLAWLSPSMFGPLFVAGAGDDGVRGPASPCVSVREGGPRP